MNRNANSFFAYNPTNVDISRSTFNKPFVHKTSFNTGELIPFYCDEVLPGDTHSIDTSFVLRMPALLTPIMDDIKVQTFYFFVPYRLVWEHWREFMGENTESAWTPTTEYEVPVIESPASIGWNVGTIADHLGVRPGIADLEVSALPFRAYALICDQWFRNQNLEDPLSIPFDETTVTGVNTGDQVTDIAKGGLPFIVRKNMDVFVSALPQPQKGPDVPLPLGDITFSGDKVPVISGADPHTVYPNSVFPIQWRIFGYGSASSKWSDSHGLSDEDPRYMWHDFGTDKIRFSVPQSGDQIGYYPSNLYADLDGSYQIGSTASINQLRLAFQIQKLYEKDARGGSRYIEIIKSHFGVTSPDARLQRCEYLGGTTENIRINQVVQSNAQAASNEDGSPLASTAAYSLTVGHHSDFTKSFTEHGLIMGVMCIRYAHTYQQGLPKLFRKKSRFDFYWPVFANIGEQAVYNSELYCQGPAAINADTGNAFDDEVFGYQEAWYEYRQTPNQITGQMRSDANNSLDTWHLGDDYSQMPELSAEFIREDKTNVDRVLTVGSSVTDQFFADIFVNNKCTRPMPLYSVPGLIDHH